MCFRSAVTGSGSVEDLARNYNYYESDYGYPSRNEQQFEHPLFPYNDQDNRAETLNRLRFIRMFGSAEKRAS